MQILYEDENIIVCNKPSGLATQSADLRSKDIVSLVKTHLVRHARKNKIKLNKEPYVGLVHRLDQPVEGILVLAKDQKTCAKLSKQITDKLFSKYYLATVEGTIKDDKKHLNKVENPDNSIYIEDEIIKDPSGNARIVSGMGQDDTKIARLEYTILTSKDGKTNVRIHLITGRFHQIRATMAYLGCPIVGDTRYGAKEKLKDGAIALCSYSLSFIHPVTGKEMHFEIEPSVNQSIIP